MLPGGLRCVKVPIRVGESKPRVASDEVIDHGARLEDAGRRRTESACEQAGIIRTVGIEVVCRVPVAFGALMASALLAQKLSPAAQQATVALKAFADDDLPKQLQVAVTQRVRPRRRRWAGQ